MNNIFYCVLIISNHEIIKTIALEHQKKKIKNQTKHVIETLICGLKYMNRHPSPTIKSMNTLTMDKYFYSYYYLIQS
jgi:hypothetical protein